MHLWPRQVADEITDELRKIWIFEIQNLPTDFQNFTDGII
jgi:hypothetical protein